MMKNKYKTIINGIINGIECILLPIPFVSQRDANSDDIYNDCGEACDAMIAKAFNKLPYGMTVDDISAIIIGDSNNDGKADFDKYSNNYQNINFLESLGISAISQVGMNNNEIKGKNEN